MDKFKLGELVWVHCSRSALDRWRLGIILEPLPMRHWTVFIGGHRESHHEKYLYKVKDNG